MKQIKTFSDVNKEKLDIKVNKWILENSEVKIEDIKFGFTSLVSPDSDGIDIYAVMIIYERGDN